MEGLILTCFELIFVTDFKEPGKKTREGSFVHRAIMCQGIKIAWKIAEVMVGEKVITLPSNSATTELTGVFKVKPCDKFPNIFSENSDVTWARVLENLKISDQDRALFLHIVRASGKKEKVGVFFTPRQLREILPE